MGGRNCCVRKNGRRIHSDAAAFALGGVNMKKNRNMAAALCAVVALAVLMAAVYRATRPTVSRGEKTITVEVVHKDETSKHFTYQTDEQYLGDLLLDEGLIRGEAGAYGLYITEVDGEQAVYEVDGGYWALYEGGAYASTGVDQTPIEDGDAFALVYTIG